MLKKKDWRPQEDWDPKQVYRIAQLFMSGMKAGKIRDTVNDEFHLRGNAEWTHQNVYAAVAKAREMEWFRFTPPVENVLASDLAREFKLRQMPIVVQPPSPMDNHLVAAKAAEDAFEFILDRQQGQISQQAPVLPVSIGLGVGRASLDFAKHLAGLIQGHKYRSHIKLNLHAITAGCASESPFFSANSLFNLFDLQNIKDAVGLFSQTICRVNEFDQVRSQSSYKAAYKRRDEIQLIANSMGCEDDHDLLSLSLKEEGADIAEWTAALKVIGNVQYRPYSAEGPVRERPTDHRAVTLFEIEDFVQLSKDSDCRVILMSRQCGLCGSKTIKTRAKAVYHLLTHPDLRVFNKLILEEAIAVEVLGMAERKIKMQAEVMPSPVSISKGARNADPTVRGGASKKRGTPPKSKRRAK